MDRPSVCSDADETMEMKMARKYYTLVEKDYDSQWTIQFGDYDRETVEQERDDIWESMIERFHGSKARTFKIVSSADDQHSIDSAVAVLNGRIALNIRDGDHHGSRP